ncbi:hypothetical protein [Streptomyces sp. DH12]|uniref:hypothetical protein n=1 Tax=Streptomyces sp. DH12 TaxID=2857010 RepID=UPI001E55E948|nr:hypothetical protein [Streptomyces sp. DH12]
MARTQGRCGAVTKQGRACRRLAMVGSARCHLHRADWATYAMDRLRLGGEPSTAPRGGDRRAGAGVGPRT